MDFIKFQVPKKMVKAAHNVVDWAHDLTPCTMPYALCPMPLPLDEDPAAFSGEL